MKKIRSALISVYYKDGLAPIVHALHQNAVTIYSTGGTYEFIQNLNIPCVRVEELTGFPSILGGRVKTLHPLVFGGILGRRDRALDREEMGKFQIPEIDMVMVDLYPFSETVESETKKSTESGALLDEQAIIEKIDIGGPSMIRAAAKNHEDVLVVASKREYPLVEHLLKEQKAHTSLEQRRILAIKAFDVCSDYDNAISSYFNQLPFVTPFNKEQTVLRYGENPHQPASFHGDKDLLFEQLSGKELSYNNLVDIDAALQLIKEFTDPCFAIIKHTNVCGVAIGENLKSAWDKALAGDPESAFGGILVCNRPMDEETAASIHDLFFEVLMAPSFNGESLKILQARKNRILLKTKELALPEYSFRSLLNGVILQQTDAINHAVWKESGGRTADEREKKDLVFANLVCKHLKSNAIALVRNQQLIGKGCGQTSRIDALRQAIEKARQFGFDLNGAVMASDAFFPFDDCVKMGYEAGISAFIQPGGSIRDSDSIDYCNRQGLVMVLTGSRHFKH
jgi:phosphoribosylaminoimidazolecarboxamide formyltransferase/IMP cyclohydrolase